jgi:tetratricopeptide (TPR) repeat protein
MRQGVKTVKRLLVGLVSFAIAVPLAFAQATPPAAGPAPAGTPAQPSNIPPVRYDWQGNHKRATEALNKRDYPTAIKLFTEILDSGRLPKSWLAPTLYFRGKAYRSSRQFDKAIADYEAAVKADPKMDVAYYEMGAAYQQKNQHAKAVTAFGQAIEIKSNNADYFYARCVSYSWLGNFGSAIRDCETASRMRPGNADLLGTLGRLYEDSGQKKQAIETYRRALAINPNQAEARDGLKALTK